MMLEICHARKEYAGNLVLEDFSLAFPETGTVCLFGPSGCGKTTLLNVLAGVEKLDSGCVKCGHAEKIACLFQHDRLLPWVSAAENVAAVLHGPTAKKEALEWLSLVGLEAAANERPASLSGGMRQRVALARALAYNAPLLLLDEPFHALDEENKARAMELIFEKAPNALKILVTHDLREAQKMADVILYVSGTPLRVDNEERASDARV